VLELPAHSIFKSRTEVGDQLVIERYEAKKNLDANQVEVAVPETSRSLQEQVH
jgi:hypothetical protein